MHPVGAKRTTMEISKRERTRKDEPCRVEDGDHYESLLPDLPQEIITEILLRLPAKSLGRFRCVSKLFLALLTDPRFTKTHLDRALQSGLFGPQNQRLILSSYHLYSAGYGRKFRKCRRSFDDDYGEDDDNDEYPVQIKVDFMYKRNWARIEGSCNGLVCISPAKGVVFLFNPTTRESKRVPELPILFRSDEKFVRAYSFGYDSVNDDYKVIKLYSGRDVTGCVYSLRTDSWKHIGNPPDSWPNLLLNSGVLLNCAIHWVLFCEGDGNKPLIAAFDLSNDKFWDMPVPDEIDCSHGYSNFVLGVLDGSLCISYSCEERHEDVWLMREYGVANSWTRLRIELSYMFMKSLSSAKNGEVLLNVDGKLVLYNLENQLSREIKIRGVEFPYGYVTETYVESLVSPNLYCRDLILAKPAASAV